MKTVYDAFDPIVNDSISQTEKGAKYEAACRWWLSQDAYWGHELARVGTLAQARGWDGCPVRDSHDVVGAIGHPDSAAS